MNRKAPLLSVAASGAAVLLLLAACGSGQGSAAGEDPPTPTADGTADGGNEETEVPETEGAEDPEDGSGLPAGGTERLDEITEPGEEAGSFFAEEGAEVGVAGLAPQDVPLQARAAPNPDAEAVADLGPLDAMVLAGRDWNDPGSESEGIWAEVELADGYGWVDGHLYFFGTHEDVTEEYIDDVNPAADEEEVARSVADRTVERVSEGGAGEGGAGGGAGEGGAGGDGVGAEGPAWVMASTPADHGEDFYRIDLTGMLDDSVAGYRLFVHTQEADDGFELVQVERTLLCSRGTGEGGACA